jgi:Mg-chelatase subunit ChlD
MKRRMQPVAGAATLALVMMLCGCAGERAGHIGSFRRGVQVCGAPGGRTAVASRLVDYNDLKGKQIVTAVVGGGLTENAGASGEGTVQKFNSLFRDAVAEAIVEQCARTRARNIELVICLDTSGSMGPLIDAARKKLKELVGRLKTLKGITKVRVALICYGNPSFAYDKGWVELISDFTEDTEYINEKLSTLTCDGGEEYVARALRFALDKLSWRRERRTLRTVFICGNESPLQDPDVTLEEVCKAANAESVILNSIFCDVALGSEVEKSLWEDLAKRGRGKYICLEMSKASKPYVAFLPSAGGAPAGQSATPPHAGPIPGAPRSGKAGSASRTQGISRSSSPARPRTQEGEKAITGAYAGTFEKDILIQAAGTMAYAGLKSFKAARAKYKPANWRPSAGETITIFYRESRPDRARLIQRGN